MAANLAWGWSRPSPRSQARTSQRRDFLFESAPQYMQRRFACELDLDVMASATRLVHVQHALRWSGQDAYGFVVPDGDYVLQVEVQADERHLQPLASFQFTKSRAAWMSTFPSSPALVDLALSYRPDR